MTIDERIEALVMNAELANREIESWRETSRRESEEIHSMIRGLAARDEDLSQRHEALTMSLELMGRDIEALRELARQDGENIRALARIAEMHERRLSDLEEPPS